MADTTTPDPYISHEPGDLITSEDWNQMQRDIKRDIAKQIGDSIAKVKEVNRAKDADQLGGKALDELLKYIMDQVFAQIPKRTGYMKLFCNLSKDADKIVEHKLGEHPLVDVYQLGYFLVACATGEEESQVRAEWALFYLYHADERRLRVDKTQIDIETTPKYRMLWKPLLDQLKEEKRLDFNDDTTLDDLETDFWRAMFAAPNDEFDPDAYCHSPWFEKCCGEKRTVGDLTKHGDFDDIYLKIKPGKTIDIQPDAQGNPKVLHEPTNVRVSHLDADTILLRDLGIWSGKGVVFTGDVDPPANYGNYMPVMVLLKA